MNGRIMVRIGMKDSYVPVANILLKLKVIHKVAPLKKAILKTPNLSAIFVLNQIHIGIVKIANILFVRVAEMKFCILQ